MVTDFHGAGLIRFHGFAYPTDNYLLNRINRTHLFGSLWHTYEHVQSIGRIAGLGNEDYMVFTHSTESDDPEKFGAIAIVKMGMNQLSNGGPFGSMEGGDPDTANSNRTIAATYTMNNHPGGLSVLGHYVYVAQWCQPHPNSLDLIYVPWEPKYAWCEVSNDVDRGLGFSVFSLHEANKNTITSINLKPPGELNYRHVYKEDWIGADSTSSIVAAKLVNYPYNFLIALGKSGGEKYGFYIASNPVGPYHFYGSSGDLDHKGENATIVSECETGDLYLFQIEATSDNVDKVHLYKMDLENGQIKLKYVKSKAFRCRGDSEISGASDWCNFDAGAGFYVTPSGKLILYATEWHQSDHGFIRVVEFPEN